MLRIAADMDPTEPTLPGAALHDPADLVWRGWAELAPEHGPDHIRLTTHGGELLDACAAWLHTQDARAAAGTETLYPAAACP
jgi:hypothetical protein